MSDFIINMIKHQIFWTAIAFPIFLFLFKVIFYDYLYKLIRNRKLIISQIIEEIENNSKEIKVYQNKVDEELSCYNEKIENYIKLNLKKENQKWEEQLMLEKKNFNPPKSIQIDESINFNVFCNMLYEKLENE